MAKTIKAADGHYLYNGENFLSVITLASEADAENWQEVDQDFYDAHNPAPESDPETVESNA